MAWECTAVSPPEIKTEPECIEGTLWEVTYQQYICTEDGGPPFSVWREISRTDTQVPC